MERRFVQTEIREESQGEISGYAAVYYDGTPGTEYELWDGAVERIVPGAFDPIGDDDITALFNHEPTQLLGRRSSGTLDISVDSKGLHYRIQPGKTSIANDVREHIKRGDVTGSSFAFMPTEERWTRDGQLNVRELRGLKVFDVGPVVSPAYAGASVQARSKDALKGVKKSLATHLKEETERNRAEKLAQLEKLGIADKRTAGRIDGLCIRQIAHPDRVRDSAERVQFRRCGSEHLGLWCIEPRWFGEAIIAVKSGMMPAIRAELEEEDTRRRVSDLYELEDGVAIIGLDGQMTKRGSSFGGSSTLRTRKAIRAALSDDKAQAIFLRIDSPGGTVAGTDELAVEIERAGRKKPVVAHIDDLGCSAAYWAASQTARISANPTAEIGSIGTVAVVRDVSGKYDREGIRVHVISTGAHKGSFVPGSVVTEDQLAALQEEVDSVNRHFLRAVGKGRAQNPDVVSEWADGRVFTAEVAKDKGLIDAIEHHDEAFSWAVEAARAAHSKKLDAQKKKERADEILS